MRIYRDATPNLAFILAKELGLTYSSVLEIGAAHPTNCMSKLFIAEGECKVTLVEANPRLFYCLKNGYDAGDFQSCWPNVPPGPHQFKGFGDNPNVTLISAAIGPTKGKDKFYELNASSFLRGEHAPEKFMQGYVENDKDAYEVDVLTIKDIDNGSHDILLCDVEGAEWHCINGLISTPKLISLETHGAKGFVNKNISLILDWMMERNYKLIAEDPTDSIFIL